MSTDKTPIPTFRIDGLDHVALKVADVERSAEWYEQVLGLTRYQKEEWGAIPVFMLAGTSGVALFPAESVKNTPASERGLTGVDHFAFTLSRQDFIRAREFYEMLGLSFEFQDHHYFHSLYTRDPDGHLVELTTLVVAPEDFYTSNQE